ncbi:MAG: GNAT family N-acetyltransferase [Clostridiales bacterium]|nr:GNAT family N-acetyltransferase [Clostridiales bacterium]
MNITIRDAKIEDIDTILEIQKKAFQFQAKKYNDYKMPPMVETFDNLKDELEKHIVLVAVKDNQIVGSIRLEKNGFEAEIRRLSVDDDWQGNGIGHMLMDVVELQDQSIKRLWLLTGAKSYRSINMYKKFGYKLYKKEEYKDYTLVFLQKFLTD